MHLVHKKRELLLMIMIYEDQMNIINVMSLYICKCTLFIHIYQETPRNPGKFTYVDMINCFDL